MPARPVRCVLPLLFVGLGACTDRDAPRPVKSSWEAAPAPGSAATGAAPATSTARPPAGVPDPAEPGISDLARLARYVFREMGRHEAVCALANPFHDRLTFALETRVAGGRIVGVGVASAGLERGDEKTLLPVAEWPHELEAFVRCLDPHLKAVRMAPAPADGVYRPEYSYPGHSPGAPAR